MSDPPFRPVKQSPNSLTQAPSQTSRVWENLDETRWSRVLEKFISASFDVSNLDGTYAALPTDNSTGLPTVENHISHCASTDITARDIFIDPQSLPQSTLQPDKRPTINSNRATSEATNIAQRHLDYSKSIRSPLKNLHCVPSHSGQNPTFATTDGVNLKRQAEFLVAVKSESDVVEPDWLDSSRILKNEGVDVFHLPEAAYPDDTLTTTPAESLNEPSRPSPERFIFPPPAKQSKNMIRNTEPLQEKKPQLQDLVFSPMIFSPTVHPLDTLQIHKDQSVRQKRPIPVTVKSEKNSISPYWLNYLRILKEEGVNVSHLPEAAYLADTVTRTRAKKLNEPSRPSPERFIFPPPRTSCTESKDSILLAVSEAEAARQTDDFQMLDRSQQVIPAGVARKNLYNAPRPTPYQTGETNSLRIHKDQSVRQNGPIPVTVKYEEDSISPYWLNYLRILKEEGVNVSHLPEAAYLADTATTTSTEKLNEPSCSTPGFFSQSDEQKKPSRWFKLSVEVRRERNAKTAVYRRQKRMQDAQRKSVNQRIVPPTEKHNVPEKIVFLNPLISAITDEAKQSESISTEPLQEEELQLQSSVPSPMYCSPLVTPLDTVLKNPSDKEAVNAAMKHSYSKNHNTIDVSLLNSSRSHYYSGQALKDAAPEFVKLKQEAVSRLEQLKKVIGVNTSEKPTRPAAFIAAIPLMANTVKMSSFQLARAPQNYVPAHAMSMHSSIPLVSAIKPLQEKKPQSQGLVSNAMLYSPSTHPLDTVQILKDSSVRQNALPSGPQQMEQGKKTDPQQKPSRWFRLSEDVRKATLRAISIGPPSILGVWAKQRKISKNCKCQSTQNVK